MLGPGRYFLGVLEIAVLLGFAGLGGWSIKRRWLPDLGGPVGALAIVVVALALLLWSAEFLGTFGLWTSGAYLALVAAIGVGLWALLGRVARGEGVEDDPARRLPPPVTGPARRDASVPALIALAIAALAFLRFALEAKTKLSTGMTGFDSTWYHGPFAAGFFQSGNTWDLHFIAPQFLAWFYPANSEVFHAAGMLAFGRDVLSPLLSLGWFVGCLLACWCVGRPYRVAPWSLGLGAIALSVPALADQAGEARNDIVGIFFLLAAVAFALNTKRRTAEVALVGLAAGLAAGTKLNFLLPAAVLVVGLAVIVPRGRRWGALGFGTLAALAGGGYWYLRNLAHAGIPLPWIQHLGPIDLPAPDQALGGREAHSVLGYLADGTVWSDWFLPGLHDGLWFLWPLLGAAALAGLVMALRGRTALTVAGLVGLAAALAWLVAPTSASGPDGMPRGFESGLRYLAPALVLGLALLPATPPICSRLVRFRSSFVGNRPTNSERNGWSVSWVWVAAAGALVLLVAAVGYPVQRHYLQKRYADPSFTTPGLNAAFAWARDVSGARIATTGTRQYPLFGTDLSNRVEFVGRERPHGGFEALGSCRQWRRALADGGYDFVVASRDRVEPGKPPFPPQAAWTAGPGATVVLREAPTVVFRLGPGFDPGACPDAQPRAAG